MRPGFPLSQEIGFISPAHLAATKGHTRNEAQPLSDTTPSVSPAAATLPLPLLSTRLVPGTLPVCPWPVFITSP